MLRRIKVSLLRRCYFIHRLSYKRFGRKSCIYKPINISGKKYISIGNNCNISEGARIEAINKWGNQRFAPSIEIGDNTSIENNLHMTSACKLKIGHDCTILSRAMITNINHNYNRINKKVNEQDLIVSDIEIGNYCFIGMDVKIFPGVKIGDNVIVGANSIVMNNLPPYSVCVGVPARVIKKYNVLTKSWERI